MIRRARQLGLITEEQYRRQIVLISSRGWRLGEPSTPGQEQSRVHSFFFTEAGERGYTAPGLAVSTGVPVGWITEMLPQAQKYQMSFSLEGL